MNVRGWVFVFAFAFSPAWAQVPTGVSEDPVELLNQARSLQQQGRYADAEFLLKRSLAIREKILGTDHPDVASSLNNLGLLYIRQGQYAQAEPLLKRSLTIDEKVVGPDHPDVATSLNNLAGLYDHQGQYAQAEPLYKRSLVIRGKALGPNHPDVAQSLNNLAALYHTQGQHAQAEPLFKRSLEIREKALGRDHPSVATSLNNLAELYRAQGLYAQAEPLYKRSLTILEKVLGPDHPSVATSLNNLALLYDRQGQYAQAEPLLKRSLAIFEKALGPDHPSVATSLNNLAFLYKSQGQYAQAEPLFKRSLAIYEKALGPDHPDVATCLNNLASLYESLGQYAQALPLARRASATYRQRIIAGGTGDAAVQEAAENQKGFRLHLSLLSRNPDAEPSDKITDESFQIAQLAQASGTASAIAKMTLRFASGDDALASLVKRKQDAAERLAKEEAQLVAAASKRPEERKTADEQRLRDSIAALGKGIIALNAELSQHFPEYQELTRPEPVPVNQIRALLKPGEAMLVYILREKGSFLWVVQPNGAEFLPLKVDLKEVTAKVAAVREQMDVDDGTIKRVDVNELHQLYQTFFAPALPKLTGVTHVMVVPAGPLQSLPFGMLVASPPPAIKSHVDYRRVDWLVKHYAFSVLPSVSSIQAFRKFAKESQALDPFAGFGDPLIGETNSLTRGKRRKADVASVFRGVKVRGDAVKSAPTSRATDIADVDTLRKLDRLPETADELHAMSKALNAGADAIWLREYATETRIKGMDLSKYRNLSFATHGLMAGDIDGAGEPGLVMTPPKQGTLEDDGYLSAGEIAKLKLNADWVVLSACNTAAADGTPGAEGLSGLAKAFFYAGARSLLVSHWPVVSQATVPLTTGMLKEYQANPTHGKAEAHRKAMLALINTPNHPEYAHPLFWAPFVVVGEGGAGGAQR
jgi:CHAT domain-containing protein/Tfp pilus assembly protein PilF